jgi:DNA integrity scanning protein DisA with diadenylate cyclase activity
LDLVLTVALLQGFFAVLLIALVVIFQEDLRYFFERVGLWWVERRLPRYKRTTAGLPRREVETLARTLGDLARAKIGALVVIRGKDAIARHIEGGENVEGRLSEPLLKSIFDPHSIGHDGAVIIDGHLIDKLGCHLPLSKNLEKLPRSGTRHAAALGLSERTDSLCLVVSEERGTISMARRGNIQVVPTPADLVEILAAFYDEIAPRAETTPLVEFFQKNYREKAVSLALAATLWVVVVQRAQPIQRTFDVPVSYGLAPSALTVAKIVPELVKVTLAGQRKAFGFGAVQDIKLVLDLSGVRKGENSVLIESRDLTFPRELKLEDIEPRHVTIRVEEKPPEANGNSKP